MKQTMPCTPAIPGTDLGPSDRSWHALFRIGAAVALVLLAGALVDIVLAMVPGWGPETVPGDVPAWFAQLAKNPLLGMRNLDFLNVTLSVVSLPLYIALLGAQRRSSPGGAILGLLLVCVGTAAFVASNAALPMLELSRQYASTAVPAARLASRSAGEALLARGAHGSYGAFPGFVISEIGTLVMALAMLRGRVFGRSVAWVGVAGTAALMVYSAGATFVSGSSALVTMIAAPGGLLMMVWYVLVARRLSVLGRGAAENGSARRAA
jgi:hypothetical protein